MKYSENGVVHQFLELWYRYAVDVFTDAQTYSEHAGKPSIDCDDVKLAIQSKVNFSFSQPPPREMNYVTMDNARQHKVQKFEDFVDKRLKPDLVHAIGERDRVFAQQKMVIASSLPFLDLLHKSNLMDGIKSSDLRKNIEALQNNEVASLRTLVNLGSEVYVQADIPDTRHIFIDVGLGFHVELTWPEALEFIRIREVRLASQVEEYTRLIASIKAQIKLVCEGIRELLQFPM